MSALTFEMVKAGLEAALRLEKGDLPTAAELSAAPMLSSWAFEEVSAGFCRLVGVVSGHPTVPDGWCTTSVLLIIDPDHAWARTISRLYRLAEPLGS